MKTYFCRCSYPFQINNNNIYSQYFVKIERNLSELVLFAKIFGVSAVYSNILGRIGFWK